MKRGLAILLIAALVGTSVGSMRVSAQDDASDLQSVQELTEDPQETSEGTEQQEQTVETSEPEENDSSGSQTGEGTDESDGSSDQTSSGSTPTGEADSNSESSEEASQNESGQGSVEADNAQTEDSEPEGEAESQSLETEDEIQLMSDATVTYRVHAQTYGWMEQVSNGAEAGTTGQSKRVESLRISVNSNTEGSIQYRAYIQGIGWTDWGADGTEVGTTGQAKRLEAFQVRLTGELAEQYDVYYCTHAQDYGWLDWAKNGGTSGTIGFDKRLESVRIVLVEKGGQAPGATATSKHIQNVVEYTTHVQTYGWLSSAKNGETGGTTGEAKRMEALQISLKYEMDGGIEFRGYVQGTGWTDWVTNFSQIGTTGQAKRLEAVQIRLTGTIAENYDVYYRTHTQTYGWLDWAKNGDTSGTVGYGKRMEAIQIRLVAKNAAAPGATTTPNHMLDGVQYSAYVEGQGWKSAENGAECGTTGQSKKLESLQLYVNDPDYSGGVAYSVYVQDYGWQSEAQNGGSSGTSNSGKRIEAVKIALTGEMAEHYDIYYQVHVQTIGWLDWAKNGEVAGTFNNSKRVESIRIQLVEKGGAAPGATDTPSYAYELTTRTYVDGLGWLSSSNGVACGTTGQGRRVEALQLSVSDDRYSGGIEYQTYMQSVGWTSAVSDGATAGTAGGGKRVEAVKINLTGELAEKYHIYYRVHVQDYGWLGWASDGSPAGTANKSKRIEAIQVMMVPKVLPAPGALRDAFSSDIYGVDVSAYNGNVIWSSVRNAGTDFAMLRITTRNLQKDSTFEANYNGAVANGVRVGVYKYGYATTVAEAKAEAQSVLDALDGRPLSFPVAYDVEDPVQQALSQSELNAIVDAFQAEIENAGYQFMLYTNLNWLNNILDAEHYADEDIWIARYRSFGLGHGYTGPGNVTIWQFTSVGSVPGITGNVDRNVAYKMY